MPDTRVVEQLLAGLNDAQRQAVLHKDGPLLIVAGPGSGKTRVLTHRFAALVATGVAPWHILSVTFTNKAAAQMRERIAALVGQQAAKRSQIATFHATCARLLRTFHNEAGLRRAFTILDSDDSAKLVKAVATEQGLLAGLAGNEVKDTLRQLTSRISWAKNAGLSADQLAASYPDGAITAAVWMGYEKRQAAIGAVDFDDLLVKTTQLLAGNTAVRERVAAKFQYVMVDEYQDTNNVQEQLLSLWTSTSNTCVVGDPDQSIYAFRGAAPAVMDRFLHTWPGAQTIILDHNYRSTQNICSVSSAIIAANHAQLRAVTHTSAEEGPPVQVRSFTDGDDEAAWVVEQIKTRQPAHENAVLIRTAALSRPIENALRKEGIAYQLTGGMSFYERAEIRDVLAWLAFAANTRDELAFARAVSNPRRGVGSTSIEAVTSFARENDVDIVTACGQAPEVRKAARTALQGFCETVAAIANSFDDGALAAVQACVVLSGLRTRVLEQDSKDGTDRIGNIDQLLEQAATYDQDPKLVDALGQVVHTLPGPGRVESFLQNTSLLSSSDDDDIADKVQVMTIHAAKGKEFDHVYVVGMEENVLPHYRALASQDDAEVAEERRLAFVAASRARHNLSLTYSASRFFFGEQVSNEPSRFLQALPSGAVNVTEGWRTFSQGPLTRPGTTRGGGMVSSSPGSRSQGVRGVRNADARFSVGDRVSHSVFGPGVVEEVSASTVSVLFDNHPVAKMLDVSVAPLVKE